VYSYKTALEYGLTGVMARSTGLKRDLRLDKMETYANYYYLNFRSYFGQHGDSYDRFLIRMNEMSESINIMNQVISKISKKKRKDKKSNVDPHYLLKYLYPQNFNSSNYKNEYNSMEKLIGHFKY
jgi:NADH-quinone oxidoreductase subunit D